VAAQHSAAQCSELHTLLLLLLDLIYQYILIIIVIVVIIIIIVTTTNYYYHFVGPWRNCIALHKEIEKLHCMGPHLSCHTDIQQQQQQDSGSSLSGTSSSDPPVNRHRHCPALTRWSTAAVICAKTRYRIGLQRAAVIHTHTHTHTHTAHAHGYSGDGDGVGGGVGV
jgi:hypothetical protein